MSKQIASVHDRMRILRDTYAREMPLKVEAIVQGWHLLLQTGKDMGAMQGLVRSFHTLAGSAASFGYRQLSETARNGEQILKTVSTSGDITPEVENAIKECLEAMKTLCDYSRTHQYKFQAEESSHNSCLLDMQDKKTIFLVEDDILLANNLKLQLECFGYDVRMFHDLGDMEQALAALTPAAIIMDMVFPEGETAGAEAITSWRQSQQEYIPVLFISRRNDIISRLAAVKAGGDAYFLKPARVTELIEKLDTLIFKIEPEPSRILIVDDDISVAEYHSLLLEQHGMESCILNDPLQVLDYLSSFNPDLILLDLNMPGCDGYHLAKVIRQVPAYFSLPIVFLSSETHLESRLQAMGTGGDDFLTKPVEPSHFISSVRIRAERMRMLRSFMERDGLSGLYSHTVMKGCIEQEFLRSMRTNSPLTLALLDLDHFKAVNDTYGHVAGDKVIVVLSRLIRQRLRRTDIIGRMGGEEFAVLLPDTSAESAFRIMESIRQDFERISHETRQESFCTTFSCGLAQMPGYNDEISFFNAADVALYNAKRAGRNRVIIV